MLFFCFSVQRYVSDTISAVSGRYFVYDMMMDEVLDSCDCYFMSKELKYSVCVFAGCTYRGIEVPFAVHGQVQACLRPLDRYNPQAHWNQVKLS